MNRFLAFAYGVVCYAVFFATFLYLIGFVGGLGVPKTVASGSAGPVLPALLADLGLIGLFGLQHSVMARPAFKRWWTRFVPPEAERSTYVLFASSVLLALFALWRPLPQSLWRVERRLAAPLGGCSPSAGRSCWPRPSSSTTSTCSDCKQVFDDLREACASGRRRLP